MIDENQIVEVKISKPNYKKYNLDNYKENIFIPFKDVIGKKQNIKVKVICDYCGKEKEVAYKTYVCSCEKHEGKYCCRYCATHNVEVLQNKLEKSQQTCMERYGVDNAFKDPEIQQKQKQTFQERYGVNHPSQLDWVLEKTIETNLKRYGETHYSKTKEYHDRVEQTLLENYGCINPMFSEECKQKLRDTNLERYGVPYYTQAEDFEEKAKSSYELKTGYKHHFQNPEWRENRWKEMVDNEYHLPVSKPENEIYNIINSVYPEAIHCYPEGRYLLDIMLETNNQKINIECDGAPWHPLDSESDKIRDEINQRKGYRIFRIRYDDQIPDAKYILEELNNFIYNSDKTFMRIGYMGE